MAFWRLYYHLIWSTDGRRACLTPPVEAQLYPYLVSKAAELDVFVYAVNGWSDHIHMIVAIPPKRSVAEVVQRLKGSSSHLLNQNFPFRPPFAWQHSYGALSVGERHRAYVEAYVRRQKEHHRSGAAVEWLERVDDPVDLL
jgi:REP element-mobilizing transposase RayT